MLSRYQYRRCVAYHEAGHALVAHVLGAEVERILIGKRTCSADGIAGLISLGPAPHGAVDEVTISLAGPVAERRAGYRSSGVAESTDLKQARHKLGAHVALEPVITRRAEAIVNRHWYDIRSLATVLQRRRRLEEDDFNKLMYQRQLGPPPPGDQVMPPDDADEETWLLSYKDHHSPPPPDRVTISDDAGDEIRLLICCLIYPEPRSLISPEWVQQTAEDLCPELTVREAAKVLCHIAEDLKDAHWDQTYSWSCDKVVTDITLIQALSVAADRCRYWWAPTAKLGLLAARRNADLQQLR